MRKAAAAAWLVLVLLPETFTDPALAHHLQHGTGLRVPVQRTLLPVLQPTVVRLGASFITQSINHFSLITF